MAITDHDRDSKIPADILGVLKSTNTTLLIVLQTKDEWLLKLSRDFIQLIRNLRKDSQHAKLIRVTYFFEELGYTKVGKVVSEQSATLASDTPTSIHTNHCDIVR